MSLAIRKRGGESKLFINIPIECCERKKEEKKEKKERTQQELCVCVRYSYPVSDRLLSFESSPLNQHCQCKCLLAHDECIAHWQLRNAGGVEELKCRFCGVRLPDWRETSLMEGKRKLTQVRDKRR